MQTYLKGFFSVKQVKKDKYLPCLLEQLWKRAKGLLMKFVPNASTKVNKISSFFFKLKDKFLKNQNQYENMLLN